jgi:hypothetical protein
MEKTAENTLEEASSVGWFDINVSTLQAEFNWLRAVISFRMDELFKEKTVYSDVTEVPVPELVGDDCPYAEFVNTAELSPSERLFLILALAPHIQPQVLDPLLGTYTDKTAITEIGGMRGQVHKGFLPTFETALFLLGGSDLGTRIYYAHHFDLNHRLFSGGWLRREQMHSLEPLASAMVIPSREFIEILTLGRPGEPEFGASFPAQKIETERDWDELILPFDTKNDIQDIIAWLQHEEQVMSEWKLGEKLNPGFRCLFHGPPGTGKTFTATLLGKATGRDVYRIDLSMVVSKYIGETEKNLKAVFDKAQSRGWILFFDEADALFGKRTEVGDSKDRYANQEVSYLLQRVENFDGIVILATNNRDNMDKAFTRRFQVVVNFPMPSATERLRLWETGLPAACTLGSSVNLLAISDRYELSGGSIMNVVRHCALRAAMRGKAHIEENDLIDGIRREYRKAGRILN